MGEKGHRCEEDAKDHICDDESRNESGQRLADEELLAADRGDQDGLALFALSTSAGSCDVSWPA